MKSAAAVSMALADPILADTQHFAVKLNWGGFDGANAVGVTAAGLVRRGFISKNDQLTLSAGVGYGESSVTGYSQSTVGGHAGAQLAW